MFYGKVNKLTVSHGDKLNGTPSPRTDHKWPVQSIPTWYIGSWLGLPVYHSMGETDLKSRIWGMTHMNSICFVTCCEIVRLFFASCSMSWWLNPLDGRDTPESQLVVSSSGFNGGKVSWDDAEAGPGTWTSSSLGSFRRFGGAPNFRPKFGCVSMGKPLMLEPHLEKHQTLMPKDPKDEREAGTWRPPMNMFFLIGRWQTWAVPSHSFRLMVIHV